MICFPCKIKLIFSLTTFDHYEYRITSSDLIILSRRYPNSINCEFLLEHFKGIKAMTKGHGGNRNVAPVKYQALD